MADIAFDVALFRAQFPAFANSTAYPDALIEANWTIATCYIDESESCSLFGNCLALAINQMAAHLLQIGINSGVIAPGGNSSGFVTSATIDKISISVQEIPTQDSAFHAWLNQTPYGVQLLALLKVKSVGGLYIGGNPETSSFRKAGGRF